MLCGRLWHAQCRADSTDLPSELPVSFQDASHYISAYEALIFEEAREAVLHSRLDQHCTETPATVMRSAPGTRLKLCALSFWVVPLSKVHQGHQHARQATEQRLEPPPAAGD